IVSTWTGKSYMSGLEGTSFAAPYVAGVAALVRARFPGLDEEAVRQRLVATADGTLGKGTGAGMVNPWQALTAILPNEEGHTPVVAPPPPSPLPADVVAKAPPVDRQAIDIASGVAVTAIFAAFLVLAARVLIPLGRRRGWRPGKSVVPVRRLDGEP